jgi:hypothetical protein
MTEIKPKRRWFRFGLRTLLVVVTLAAVGSWGYWVAWPWLREYRQIVDLIEQMRDPMNKVQYLFVTIPGGEVLQFSPPMKQLIRMGARARPALHRRISDKEIQNEVVLILGAIGDETTVPLLIESYPDQPADLAPSDPRFYTIVYYSFALPYLTCEPIGRSREGADLNPENKKLWQAWWKENAATFKVSAEKPNMTWLPGYPIH